MVIESEPEVALRTEISRDADAGLCDVIVIGAMKAGTTTLFDMLARHPEIGVSREKETDFFLGHRVWQRGLSWYADQFPRDRRVRVEASPNYTKREAFPGVPERVRELLPHCRFVFLARDPVKRALSQYTHLALQAPDTPPPDKLIGSETLRHMVDVSSYAQQMEPWLEAFPKERFLFVEFEDYVQDSAPTLRRVARHIGVSETWGFESVAQSNSREMVAKLPGWYFRVRDGSVGRVAKGMLSPQARSRVKEMLSFGAERRVSPVGREVREILIEQLADDARRFRALSGLQGASWTV